MACSAAAGPRAPTALALLVVLLVLTAPASTLGERHSPSRCRLLTHEYSHPNTGRSCRAGVFGMR
eukprot:364933-Chlamydomonas_euryale.AAC.3